MNFFPHKVFSIVYLQSGHLLHKKSNLCLDSTNKQTMALVTVAKCTAKATQQWWFDHYNIG